MYYENYYSNNPRLELSGFKFHTKNNQEFNSWLANSFFKELNKISYDDINKGKTYARNKRVNKIDINQGYVQSTVSSNSEDYYKVSIKFRTNINWDILLKEFLNNKFILANIFNNIFVEEILTLCKKLNFTFLQFDKDNFIPSCECYAFFDYKYSCKHINALYYLLAKLIDVQPIILFMILGCNSNFLFNIMRLIIYPEKLNDDQFDNIERHNSTAQLLLFKNFYKNYKFTYWNNYFLNIEPHTLLNTEEHPNSLLNIKYEICKSTFMNNTLDITLNFEEDIEGSTYGKLSVSMTNQNSSTVISSEMIKNIDIDNLELFIEENNYLLIFITLLTRAAHIYPKLIFLITEESKNYIHLNEEEIEDFIANIPLLERLDVQVHMPNTVKVDQDNMKLVLDSKPINNNPTFDLNGLLEYDWKLAINNKQLTDKEFTAFVNKKNNFLYIDKKWVYLSSEQKEEIQKFIIANNKENENTLRKLFNNVISTIRDNNKLPSIEISKNSALHELFDNSKTNLLNIKESSFNGVLRDYQLHGISWLYFLSRISFGACLADDMGLGKTIQVLGLLNYEKEKLNNKRASLLICPMSLMMNWYQESKKFTPNLKLYIHHGTQRNKIAYMYINDKNTENIDLVITTYSIIRLDNELFSSIKWNHIILDEAHNIKNYKSKQSQAIYLLNSEHKIALTGTPIENKLEDLWSLFHFLNPGLLNNLTHFKRNYVSPISKNKDTLTTNRLKTIIKPFLLRRLKTDPKIILALPEKMEIIVPCLLTTQQATLYQAVLNKMLKEIKNPLSSIKRSGIILSTITKLKLICNHPILVDPSHITKNDKELKASTINTLIKKYKNTNINKLFALSGKLQQLEDILYKIINNNEKVLCFTQYSSFGHILQIYCKNKFPIKVFYIHGGISQKNRTKIIEEFKSINESAIFILSLKVGGVGLNLTVATQVIHVDRWWNPAVEEQATDRVYRIGQTKNVQVRKFICIGTIEEKINAKIESKKELVSNVIHKTTSWITKMNNKEIEDLFMLSKDAVMK